MSYSITPGQRRAHVIFEALAVFALVPFTAMVAARKTPLNEKERAILWTVAGITLLIDGSLLSRYARSQRDDEEPSRGIFVRPS